MKSVVLDNNGNLVHSQYIRHFSQIRETAVALLSAILSKIGDEEISIGISGSAGMGLAQNLDLAFVQEVYATRLAVKHYLPSSDVVIELGGEDAKILFLGQQMEVRMNGTCAGGTGSFIDQMASLLHVSQDEMDILASHAQQNRKWKARGLPLLPLG